MIVWVLLKSNSWAKITGVEYQIAGVFSSRPLAEAWVKDKEAGCWIIPVEVDKEVKNGR